MTTHFYTASSLDGFIATPEHSLEWLFKQDFDFEGPMAYPEFVKGIGALFMGASTYEWLLSNQDEWGYEQPVWVFTHRDLPVPEGADIRFVQGSVTQAHAEAVLAAQGKDIWVVGAANSKRPASAATRRCRVAIPGRGRVSARRSRNATNSVGVRRDPASRRGRDSNAAMPPVL